MQGQELLERASMAGLRPHRAFVYLDFPAPEPTAAQVVAVLGDPGYHPRYPKARGRSATTFRSAIGLNRFQSRCTHTHCRVPRVGPSVHGRLEACVRACVVSDRLVLAYDCPRVSPLRSVRPRARRALDIVALMCACRSEIDVVTLASCAARWRDSPRPVLQSLRRVGIEIPAAGARRVRLPSARIAFAREYAARSHGRRGIPIGAVQVG
jgi:hypothetical protein